LKKRDRLKGRKRRKGKNPSVPKKKSLKNKGMRLLQPPTPIPLL